MKTKTEPALPEKIIRNVGDPMVAYGRPAKIIKVHPFGTVDVVTVDGRHFRITGLRIYR